MSVNCPSSMQLTLSPAWAGKPHRSADLYPKLRKARLAHSHNSAFVAGSELSAALFSQLLQSSSGVASGALSGDGTNVS
jgi:hypothetical protein